MKTAAFLAAGLAAALALPGAVAAATFSGGWTVSYNSADPGLVVETEPGAGYGSTPDLAVGQDYTFDLFRIWTDEPSVAREDEAPKPISVAFAFVNPVAGGVISGVTEGERSGFFGSVQNGRVTWDGPLVVSFGQANTGRFTLSLSDAVFNRGFFGLTEGYGYGAAVQATLRYDAAPAPAPVPLPAALPLLAAGIGAMGLAARRRRAAV